MPFKRKKTITNADATGKQHVEKDYFEAKERDESELNEIKNSLSKIYKSKTGRMADITRLERKKRNIWLRLMVATIFLSMLAVATYAGYLLFSPKGSDYEGSVEMEIKSLPLLPSGDTITYQIHYHNNKRVSLNKVHIELLFPLNFTFKSSSIEPFNDDNSIFIMPYLKAKSSGVLEITGQLIGDEKETKTLTAILTYQPDNFNSDFIVSKSFSTEIAGINFILNLDGPAEVLAEEESEYTLRLENKLDQDLEGVRITLSHDDNAEVVKVSPDFKSQNTWEIEKIEKGASMEIDLVLKFLRVEENNQLNFILEIKDEGGRYYRQLAADFGIKSMKGDLFVKIEINGSDGNNHATLGEKLDYTVNYENKSEKNLGEVEIMVEVNSELIDWESLEDPSQGIVGGKTIKWSKVEVGKLSKVLVGDTGKISFSIKLKGPEEVVKENIKDSKIISRSTARIGAIDDMIIARETVGNEITTTVNSDFNVNSKALYYDDDNNTIGAGPIPPIVGVETSYAVFVTITNTLHEIQDIKVSTILPQQVEWGGIAVQDTGEVSYDSESKAVVWRINRLPKGINQAKMNFSVNLKPTEEDLNKVLLITGGIDFSAKDKSTDNIISGSAPAKKTSLEDDPFANSDGLIRGPGETEQ